MSVLNLIHKFPFVFLTKYRLLFEIVHKEIEYAFEHNGRCFREDNCLSEKNNIQNIINPTACFQLTQNIYILFITVIILPGIFI